MTPRPDFGEDSYTGYNRLVGKVALITGGDSGIGRAVAVAFAKEGADVAIQFLPAEREDAEEVARVVKKQGRKIKLIEADFTDPKTYKMVVDETVSEFGRLDLLINNAAYQGKQMDQYTDLDFDRVETAFRVNIISQMVITKHAIPHMKPGSSIVCTSSIQAYQPNPAILDYAVTKGAIATFVKGLAQELTSKGVRVNAVAPGPIYTPILQVSFKLDKQSKSGAAYPIGRPGQPVELAPSYVFLCSSDAHYISGEVLGVTGGKPL